MYGAGAPQELRARLLGSKMQVLAKKPHQQIACSRELHIQENVKPRAEHLNHKSYSAQYYS